MSDVFTYDLGETARDTISGYEGTVVARFEYLNGCIRYELMAKNKTKTDEPKGFIFDEEQLERVGAKKKPKGRRSGGPMPTPPRTGTR